jgi:hypothetical protein
LAIDQKSKKIIINTALKESYQLKFTELMQYMNSEVLKEFILFLREDDLIRLIKPIKNYEVFKKFIFARNNNLKSLNLQSAILNFQNFILDNNIIYKLFLFLIDIYAISAKENFNKNHASFKIINILLEKIKYKKCLTIEDFFIYIIDCIELFLDFVSKRVSKNF